MRLLRRSSNEFPVIAAADLAVATEDFEANGQIRLNAAQFRLRPELCFFVEVAGIYAHAARTPPLVAVVRLDSGMSARLSMCDSPRRNFRCPQTTPVLRSSTVMAGTDC